MKMKETIDSDKFLRLLVVRESQRRSVSKGQIESRNQQRREEAAEFEERREICERIYRTEC